MKRWSPAESVSGNVRMRVYPSGDFVLYADAMDMEARIAELESEITELQSDLEWVIPARAMSPAEIRAARKGE